MGPARLGVRLVLLVAMATGCAARQIDIAGPENAADVLRGAKAPPAPFHATTSFRMTQNSIQVEATLDGRRAQGPLLLDSGAPMTISADAAQKLDLPPLAHVTLEGPDGKSEPARVVRIPGVDVAGLSFESVGAVLDWVAPPNPVACLSTVGLAGASLLRAAIWQLDFHAMRLTVTNDIDALPGIEYALRLPFRTADAAGSPRIDVRLPGIPHASLLIDLGFNGSIAMPPELYRRAGGILAVDTPAQMGAGAATVLGETASTLYIGRIAEVGVGGLVLHDFPVVTGNAVSDFHVGVEFLRHFRTTIDWQSNHVYLQRRDSESELYDDFTSYGFTPTPRNGNLVIGALWRDGAAAKAGLELDDVILTIDGENVTTDFDTYCSLLDAIGLYGARTDPIEIRVQRGPDRHDVTVRREPLAPKHPRGVPRPSQ